MITGRTVILELISVAGYQVARLGNFNKLPVAGLPPVLFNSDYRLPVVCLRHEGCRGRIFPIVIHYRYRNVIRELL